MVRGEYDGIADYVKDHNKGGKTVKALLNSATKTANMATGQKLTNKAYLQQVSSYAVLGRANKNSHHEGMAEAIGKYIQGGKNSNDHYGKAVYDNLKALYKSYGF